MQFVVLGTLIWVLIATQSGLLVEYMVKLHILMVLDLTREGESLIEVLPALSTIVHLLDAIVVILKVL